MGMPNDECEAFREDAAAIIDDVCWEVEKQHPEIVIKYMEGEEGEVEKALIYGEDYYNLEDRIASVLKRLAYSYVCTG